MLEFEKNRALYEDMGFRFPVAECAPWVAEPAREGRMRAAVGVTGLILALTCLWMARYTTVLGYGQTIIVQDRWAGTVKSCWSWEVGVSGSGGKTASACKVVFPPTNRETD
jgi:hypothetical protein